MPKTIQGQLMASIPGTILLSGIVLMFSIIFLSSNCFGDDSQFPMTITDSAGRVVTIPMPVERIIVLGSDHAEAVMLLGDKDKIVGAREDVVQRPEYFPGLEKTQVVGGWNENNFEKFAEVAKNGKNEIVPDIIVLAFTYPDQPYGAANIAKGLEPFKNITVIGLDFYKPENLTGEVSLLGKILGRTEQAEKYLDWVNSSREKIGSAIQGKAVPKVYFEGDNKGGLGELSSYGNGSGINGMIQSSGGLNIAGELKMYPKVSWEWVINENPDVILRRQTSNKLGFDTTSAENMTTIKELREEMLARTGAENITAVKDGRVNVIFWSMLMGMDSVAGQAYLAKIFHPEIDLNPEEMYREYLEFLGMELPKDRAYVYPPL